MSLTRRVRQALKSRRQRRSSGFRRVGIELLESRRVLSTVTFDADPSIDEGDNGTQVLVFTVRRDANDGPETVDFSVTGNSATLGIDFQDVSGTLDFNQGNDLVDTISVPIIGDTTVELDETFFVDLANPTAGLVIGDDEGIGTITNDDTATVTASNVTLAEGDAGNTAFEFTVALSGNVDTAFTVDIATGNFNATAGVDYDNNFANLSFDGNDGDQQTFTVQVTGDTDAEVNETFSATLFDPQAGGRSIVLSSGLGTITNDDAILAVSSVTLNEGDAGDTAFEFTATLTGDVDPFTVDIATVDIPGGATGGVDFTANSAMLNFAGNDGEQQTFTVQVSGENLVEADESFAVELSNLPAGGSTFTVNNGTGTITNDDSAVVSVSGGSVNEATGMVDFTVALSNPVDTDVTVDFSTTDDTATAGTDFTGITNQQVTFVANDVSETVTVTIADDMVVERDEMLGGVLSNLIAGERSVTQAEESGVATILNDDIATLTASNVTAVEGDTGDTAFDFTIALAGSVDTAFTVDITTFEIPGGATAGIDFTANQATLNFTGNDGQQQTFTVQVSGEDLVEMDEMFGVDLNVQADGRTVNIVNGAGTITNDDATTLSIVAAQDSVPEGNSGTTAVTYTVTSSHAVPGGFTVALNAAGAEVEDFDLSANMLTFVGDVAGEQQTFVLNVVGESLVELNETVTVTLGEVSGTATGINPASVATGAMASTTITNDDLATVSIDNVILVEGDGPDDTAFNFTLSIDNLASHDITVVTNTAAMSATGGGIDFTDVVNETVTIPAGSNSAMLTVNVAGENLVELEETFQVNLSGAQFNGADDETRAVASNVAGIGTITNDDAAVLSIADVSQAEGDSGQTAFLFTLTLTNPVDTNVTVDATTSDGSAIASQDYTALAVAPPFTITSPNTTGTVTVQVTGETMFEAAENFQVAIGNLVAGGRTVTLGDTQAVGTIVNDDTRIAGFAYLDANSNGQRDEGETGLAGALITVTRTDILGAVDAEPPTREILTGLDGSYVFMDQPAGTYTVAQRQPLAMVDGQETVGTGASGPGNATTNDTIQQIVLAAGEDGQGYNFGELRTVAPVSMRWYLASSAALPLLLRERIANVEELAGNAELAARIRAGESTETAVASVASPAGEGEELLIEEVVVEEVVVEEVVVETIVVETIVVESPPQAEAESVVTPVETAAVELPSDSPEQPLNGTVAPAPESGPAESGPAEMVYGPMRPDRGETPVVVVVPMPEPTPELGGEGEGKSCTFGPRRPTDTESESTVQLPTNFEVEQAGQSDADETPPRPSVAAIDQALIEVQVWRDLMGPLPIR